MTEIKWSAECWKVSDLKGMKNNPRKLGKHDADHLQKSLEKFGQCEPVVINADGTIIGGHQRVRTLKKIGKKEVDVYVPNIPLSDQEINELNIRLNRNAGEWDFDILANDWDLDELLSWGFTQEDFSIDVDVIDEKEESESCEQMHPPKDPVTKTGDLYELGGHRLLCGDSTSPDDVHKLLDGGEPILMVTDPPYGVEYAPSWRSRAGKGKRAVGKVQNDDKVNWALAWSLFPGNVAYVWCASLYLPEVVKDLEDADFERKSLIIWAKQHFALSRGDYHWQYESCWYAVRKNQAHNWQGSRKESTLWEIGNLAAYGKSQDEDARTPHSTQKPLQCMERPIKNNTQEGDSVYDPFTGSGTTLIAAEKLGRMAYCMEIDPAYCDVIVDRFVSYCDKNKIIVPIIKNGVPVTWGDENG